MLLPYTGTLHGRHALGKGFFKETSSIITLYWNSIEQFFRFIDIFSNYKYCYSTAFWQGTSILFKDDIQSLLRDTEIYGQIIDAYAEILHDDEKKDPARQQNAYITCYAYVKIIPIPLLLVKITNYSSSYIFHILSNAETINLAEVSHR